MKKACWTISWRNTLIDWPRFLLVTQKWLLYPWGTSWMWVYWEDGAPPRPLVVWLSTRAHLQAADQMLGLGQGQKAGTMGNRDPIPRGEGILILHSWPVVTRPWNDQVAGKHPFLWQVNLHFCVRNVSLVWGRFFSELSEALSYR